MHFLFQTPNCMFQGNCIVDVRTRRFCPHCRLKKCFNMGMKKEMILGRCKSIFVISVDYLYELRHEKTCFLHKRKQRCRPAERLKFKTSSHLLLYSPVYVGCGRKPRTQVFSPLRLI